VKKVLFVCTANICRSPLVQEIFNALAENGGLPFWAESAGTAPLEDRPIAANALAALEEAGIYPEEAHSARLLSEEMSEGAALVLAMTSSTQPRCGASGATRRAAYTPCRSTRAASREEGSRTLTG
jgi:protein-tyrosine-phosphatase